MAKKNETYVPTIVDNVDALIAKMNTMREAQKVFASYTQEQVDRIFLAAASAANKARAVYYTHLDVYKRQERTQCVRPD